MKLMMMRAEQSIPVPQWPVATMKTEPIDTDRQNDSGISPGRTSSENNSNSPKFQNSSSPASDSHLPSSTSTPKQDSLKGEALYHATPNSHMKYPILLNHHDGVVYPPTFPDLAYPRLLDNYSPFHSHFSNFYKFGYGYSPIMSHEGRDRSPARSERSPKAGSDDGHISSNNNNEKSFARSPVSPGSASNSSKASYKSQNGEKREMNGIRNGDQNEDSLERLKQALENSSALSGIFKSSRSEDDENSQEIERKEFSCPLCAYTTPYRHRYIEHVHTHYSDKCTLCDFQGQDLRVHLQEAHNITDLQDLGEAQDSDNEEDDTNTPNKRSKSKTFKCKQCNYITNTKLDFWEHSKEHIKVEKLLTCPKCPFVTEYKHHLEYHLRNHFGSKPFKCSKCPYSCVNKSMLNSHLKSHSNIYQYRCSDCAYATKYCHSLKLHLRKYQHKPSVVLNSDGTPNPLPIIDVYGTRRGPKQKVNKEDKTLSIKIPTKHISPITSPKELIETRSEPAPTYLYCNDCEFSTLSQELLTRHSFIHASETNFTNYLQTNNNVHETQVIKEYFNNVLVQKESPYHNENSLSPASLISPRIHSPVLKNPISPLDLSKQNSESDNEFKRKVEEEEEKVQRPAKHRRKGKAYKLERVQEYSEEEPDNFRIRIPEFKVTVAQKEEADSGKPVENNPDSYSCSYCDISFKDIIMYTMHMGYHGYQDPFTCNMCGQVTPDKVAFFLHIARSSHS